MDYDPSLTVSTWYGTEACVPRMGRKKSPFEYLSYLPKKTVESQLLPLRKISKSVSKPDSECIKTGQLQNSDMIQTFFIQQIDFLA
jgi:hypothetical protein